MEINRSSVASPDVLEGTGIKSAFAPSLPVLVVAPFSKWGAEPQPTRTRLRRPSATKLSPTLSGAEEERLRIGHKPVEHVRSDIGSILSQFDASLSFEPSYWPSGNAKTNKVCPTVGTWIFSELRWPLATPVPPGEITARY